MSASIEQRNQDATCYTGNLDASVTEALLWEVSEERKRLVYDSNNSIMMLAEGNLVLLSWGCTGGAC